jgi:hypothetical protein
MVDPDPGTPFGDRTVSARAGQDQRPARGESADFSQIVGIDYRISYTAEPTEVVVEDPVTIKIRITGKDPPGKDAKKYQPQRRFLQLFSEDDRHNFYIEPVAGQDRFVPGKNGQNTWEFVYRVRPKSMRVKQVPAPNLAYYWPGRGYVRVPADQERIPLTVTPRGVTDSDVLGLKDIKVPERLYQLATGDALLAREDPWPYWNPPLLIALGFGIPIASWLGVSFWQWMFPDSLRRLQRRRSLAARRAVRELGQSKNACSASSLAGILARYLRQRLDFPAVEPTPAEVARFLRRRGVLAAAAQQWADLFRSLDEARYTPANVVDSMPPPEGDLWTTHAANLIHALEADPCLARMR